MSSRFLEFVADMHALDLGEPRCASLPPRDSVRALQDMLSRALGDPEFRLDCSEREIERLIAVDAHQVPMHADERGIRMRMFHWAPGAFAPAHEHTFWTVTAVAANMLEVTTFDWDVAVRERRLERKHVFAGEAGRAGHIYTPCIHRPRNPSARASSSIHIFHVEDRPVLEATVGPIPGLARPTAPEEAVSSLAAAALQRSLAFELRRHVDLIAAIPSARAVGLLAHVLRVADAGTRWSTLRALERRAPELHRRWAQRLATTPVDTNASAHRDELEAVLARRFARTGDALARHVGAKSWRDLLARCVAAGQRHHAMELPDRFRVELKRIDPPDWIAELADFEIRTWAVEIAPDAGDEREPGDGTWRVAASTQWHEYEHDLVAWIQSHGERSVPPAKRRSTVVFWRDRTFTPQQARLGARHVRALQGLRLGSVAEDHVMGLKELHTVGVVLGASRDT
jgi:predicted metal-dependent enzyme (double-stranded beta helix superfamily)